MSKHLMIDIETLGTKYGSAIKAIAVVAFEPFPMDTQVGVAQEDRYGWQIDLESNLLAGLKADAETLHWWDRQEQNMDDLQSVPLHQALKQVSEVIDQHQPTTLWAHGKDFDFPLLGCAYEALSLTPPWQYWQLRCSRDLIFTIFGERLKKLIGRENDHKPIQDALNQVEGVQLAFKELAYLKGLKDDKD